MYWRQRLQGEWSNVRAAALASVAVDRGVRFHFHQARTPTTSEPTLRSGRKRTYRGRFSRQVNILSRFQSHVHLDRGLRQEPPPLRRHASRSLNQEAGPATNRERPLSMSWLREQLERRSHRRCAALSRSVRWNDLLGLDGDEGRQALRQ